ncbi:MAG: PepSY domain-containing protein [Cryobacterium sp.]|nr:PepSY domain-containing protein [Cryobacterium sp.]
MSKTTMRIAAIVLAAGLGGALVGCTDTTDPGLTDPPIIDEQPGDQPTDEPTDEPITGISMEDAIDIAMNEYGGTFMSVDADSHNGEATWSVMLTGTTDGDIEVDVSQATGQIVAVDGE